MLIACYGSLKEGHYNHDALGALAKFLGTTKVNGVMYSNGSYPKLYKVNSDMADLATFLPNEKNEIRDGKVFPFTDSEAREHKVEVYDVSDQAFRAINNMELGAGYEGEELVTEYGVATIYWMPHESFDETDEWVEKY